jgi:signal peptidase II
LFLPVVTLITVIVDQLVKREVLVVLRPGQSWSPIPALEQWFSFTYVTNTGAAFGLFPSHGYVFVLVAAIVGVAIAIYYWHMPAGQVLIKLSLGMQLGGAMGNLIDRLLYGHVIDFIDFKFWPVFNLADTSIVLGVALLAYALLRDSEDEKTAIVQGSKNAL